MNAKPATPPTWHDLVRTPGAPTYGETLARLLELLGRARRALDQAAPLDFFMRPGLERLAGEIADMIGHPVTDGEPADDVVALIEYLDDDAPPLHEWQCPACGATTRARMADADPDPCDDCTWEPGGEPCSFHADAPATVPMGGPGCDITMVHYFGPRDAPVAGLFDDRGHPRNCPAYLNLGPSRRAPESRESAPRTEDESPAARATRLDRERDEAGRAYRTAIHAADQAWRAIGGR